MFTLDGYGLLVDNDAREIEGFIKKYIPTQSYMPWIRQSFPGFGLMGLAFPNSYGAEPSFKLNKFRHPSTASRWSFGHFLADSDTVYAISQDAYAAGGKYNTVRLVISSTDSANLNPSGQGGNFSPESVGTNVYLLPPTPLSGIRGLGTFPGSQNTTQKSLYLLTVVDARYFWWFQNIGAISISPSTTWGSLYSTIANILGVTISNDPINANYLSPSIQAWSVPYEPIPVILDAVAYNVGQRICVDMSSGTLYPQNYTTAVNQINMDMQNNGNRVILSGGQRFASPL